MEHVKSSLDKLSQVVQVKSEICLTQNILDPKIVMDLKYLDPIFSTLGLHLGFSAKLKIWQVPACKMEPRSGMNMQVMTTNPATPMLAYLSTEWLLNRVSEKKATLWLHLAS